MAVKHDKKGIKIFRKLSNVAMERLLTKKLTDEMRNEELIRMEEKKKKEVC